MAPSFYPTIGLWILAKVVLDMINSRRTTTQVAHMSKLAPSYQYTSMGIKMVTSETRE